MFMVCMAQGTRPLANEFVGQQVVSVFVVAIVHQTGRLFAAPCIEEVHFAICCVSF